MDHDLHSDLELLIPFWVAFLLILITRYDND